MRTILALVAIVAIATTACNSAPEQKAQLVLLISLGEVDEATVNSASRSLIVNYVVHVDFDEIDLPKECYYEPRDRYRADKILDFLEQNYPDYDCVIAVTEADISTTVDGHEDWGVFGFGRQPGQTAVVSTFRLKKDEPTKDVLDDRIQKVVLHEYGHTTGLPHCTSSGTCPMQDADGKIATVDKSKPYLCGKCEEKAKKFVKPEGAA